jgi:hypothetical protein
MRAVLTALAMGLVVLAAGAGWSVAKPEDGSSLKPVSAFSWLYQTDYLNQLLILQPGLMSPA